MSAGALEQWLRQQRQPPVGMSPVGKGSCQVPARPSVVSIESSLDAVLPSPLPTPLLESPFSFSDAEATERRWPSNITLTEDVLRRYNKDCEVNTVSSDNVAEIGTATSLTMSSSSACSDADLTPREDMQAKLDVGNEVCPKSLPVLLLHSVNLNSGSTGHDSDDSDSSSASSSSLSCRFPQCAIDVVITESCAVRVQNVQRVRQVPLLPIPRPCNDIVGALASDSVPVHSAPSSVTDRSDASTASLQRCSTACSTVEPSPSPQLGKVPIASQHVMEQLCRLMRDLQATEFRVGAAEVRAAAAEARATEAQARASAAELSAHATEERLIALEKRFSAFQRDKQLTSAVTPISRVVRHSSSPVSFVTPEGRVVLLTLDTCGGKRLGIRLREKSCVIDAVTAGLVMDWNATHTGSVVARGAEVVEVNGVGGSASSMCEELRKGAPLLQLRIRLPHAPSARCGR